MWDAVGESLKVFFEKHLIPTVIAIVSAIIAVLMLPSDFWMIKKIGKTWFMVLVAGVVFLIIQILILIWKGIRELRYRAYISSESSKYKARESEETLEEWLSFMDNLPPEERDLIISFIKSGNKPITEHGYIWRNPESIYNSNLIVKTKTANGATMIKLNDKAFRVLKAIYDDRGSISHF